MIQTSTDTFCLESLVMAFPGGGLLDPLNIPHTDPAPLALVCLSLWFPPPPPILLIRSIRLWGNLIFATTNQRSPRIRASQFWTRSHSSSKRNFRGRPLHIVHAG